MQVLLAGREIGEERLQVDGLHLDAHGVGPEQGLFCIFSNGDVPDDAGETKLVTETHLAHRELCWKGRSVASQSLHLPAEAHNACFAGCEIAFDIAVMAAQKSRRRARAIELDPLYVDVAIRRWQTYTGQMATMAVTGESFEEVEQRRRDPLQ